MKKRYILFLLIALGVIASLFAFNARYQTEESLKHYEITMPFEQVLAMAEMKNASLADELSYWKEAGIDSIALDEINLFNLKQRTDKDIIVSYRGNDVVIRGDKALLSALAERFQEHLQAREIELTATELVIEGSVNDFYIGYLNSKNTLVEESMGVSVRTASLLEYLGLGYDSADIEAIKAAGLAVRLRPSYVAALEDAEQAVDNLISAIDEYTQQPYLVFSGKEIVGFGGAEAKLAEALAKRHIAPALIENPVQRKHVLQKGLNSLVERLDYRALRVFSTWDFIRNRYDYEMPLHHNGEEIINTYYRAITERNISVIYFKPFTKNNRIVDLPVGVYQDNFKVLEQRLAAHKITPYDSGDFYRKPLHTRRAVQLLAAIAVVAAGILILDLLFDLPLKFLALLLALALIPTALLYVLGKGLPLINSLFGFMTTVVFAGLAIVFILKRGLYVYQNPQGHNFIKSAFVLLQALAISMLGAILEVAFFADSKYILEMAIFRGVKLSQMLPLAFALLVSVVIFAPILFPASELSYKERIIDLLNQTIKLWQIMLGGLALLLVLLFLVRSGHDGNIKPPTLELLFRNSLEYFLYARPRSKSFIIAFPAFFILFDLIRKNKYKLVYPFLAVLMAIGQSDVLNTFSHFRTPLIISAWRIVYAYILGIVVYGLLYLAYIIMKKIVAVVKAMLV